MHNTRREFLKKTASLSAFSVFSISGLLNPQPAQGEWLKDHFQNESFETVFKRLFNDKEMQDTHKISLSLPKKAENGAVVPITIKSRLENINKLYILVEKNPTPLAAFFELSPLVDLYIKARIKMAESSRVVVVASGNDQFRNYRDGGHPKYFGGE